MARITKAVQSTAYHEAGHAVAAWKKGVRTKKLSIMPDEDSDGRHERYAYFTGIRPEWDNSSGVQRRLENMAFVCCAGPAAQRRFSPKGARSYHGAADREQANDLLSYLTGDDDVLAAHFKLIDLRARKFVALPHIWPLIEDLAVVLLERREMSSKEVRATILESVRKRSQPSIRP